MKIGMNLLLWTGQLSDELIPVLEQLKEIGFDGVEIPVFHNDPEYYSSWTKRLDDLGLERTAVTVRNSSDNPASPDASVRRLGVAETKRALDCCQVLGATHLAGPFHSAIGEFSGSPPTVDEWKWAVDSMQQVSDHAGQTQVTLSVEPLNRFETYLLNSIADVSRFVREVNHPRCRVLYDTFHANIEEKNTRGAIIECRDVVGEVHISENDRSTPGQGNVRWDENFDALKEIDYDGWMVIEAFGLALPELAAATKIWRKMYESELQLARDGFAFIQQNVARRWTE